MLRTFARVIADLHEPSPLGGDVGDRNTRLVNHLPEQSVTLTRSARLVNDSGASGMFRKGKARVSRACRCVRAAFSPGRPAVASGSSQARARLASSMGPAAGDQPARRGSRRSVPSRPGAGDRLIMRASSHGPTSHLIGGGRTRIRFGDPDVRRCTCDGRRAVGSGFGKAQPDCRLR